MPTTPSKLFTLFLLAFVVDVKSEQAAASNNVSKQQVRTLNLWQCKKSAFRQRCDKVTISSGDFQCFPNGSVHVHPYAIILDQCHYDADTDSIIICKPESNVGADPFDIPCGIQLALSISIISVVLPLFFAMLTEDVKDLTHVNWKGLIISLFFFHFLLQLVNLDKITDVPEFKYTFPALMHFFTLTLLSWMAIFSHDGLMMGEAVVGNRANYMELLRNYKGYVLSVLITIVLLVTVTIITEVSGLIPDIYRPRTGDFCWLTQKSLIIFFTGPVVAFSSINYINFISAKFYFSRQPFRDGPVLDLKKNYLIHFKLFVIMNITWCFGVFFFLANSKLLWDAYVITFILQESFFVVVPFNKDLEGWVLEKLSCG